MSKKSNITHDCRKGIYPSPRRFSIHGPAPKPSPVHSEALGGSFPTLPGMEARAMEDVLLLKGTLPKRKDVLLVGAGPSGANWEELCNNRTYVVATNSAFGKIGKRADLLICTEPAGIRHGWFTQYPDKPRVVTHKAFSDGNNQFVLNALKLPHMYPVALSGHTAGFNPREYINPMQLSLPDGMARDTEGFDPESNKEYGLLQGQLCWPGRMHVGTVYVSALHMLAIMGVAKVKTIGFDFCTKDKVVHWTEPNYVHRPDPAIPSKCFIIVNGIETLWHFALSAAYAVSLLPVFKDAGMIIKDFSEGLMQMEEVETLMEHIGDEPRSIYRGGKTKYQAKIQQGKAIDITE